jgi:hypothetical protein
VRIPLLPLVALVSACGPTAGRTSTASCGFAAVAGPTLVLSEFNTPGAALSSLPASLPPRLVARFVAGPARAAVVGRRGDSLEVGIEGALPATAHPGFGVLVTDTKATVRGVLVFDGAPVLNAPVLGEVTTGPTRVPLIGITLDPARVENPGCPFFPDSTLL